MDVQRIDYEVNLNQLRKEVDQIEYADQICLQGFDEMMDPLYGSRRISEINPKYSEYDFETPLFPEMEYTNQVLNDLMLYRSRLMRFSPKTCLSYHRDPSKRIHIPLYTNKHCFLLIDEKAHHLEEGQVYLCDTTKMHTAINASFDMRIHIVGIV